MIDTDQEAAQELVKVAKELIAGSSAQTLMKMRNGDRKTLNTGDRGLYIHIWFDEGTGETDFGSRVPESGEWEVVISRDEDALRGKTLVRENFRYVEGKMKGAVARMAVGWISKKVR